MIAVVADDLAGAAELGGVGSCHGLSAEIHTEFDATSRADLVAVDTDSRCCSDEEAARRVDEAANRLQSSRPE